MNMIKKILFLRLPVLFCIIILFSFNINGKRKDSLDKSSNPRIVNIINFIRFCEPRNPAITENVLYQTVVHQINIMKKYHLRGTFLLQYDALIDPRYQKLLKTLPRDSFEIGAWWEIPQSLVEDAGLRWKGKASWDPYFSGDFSIGYSPADRKKLADTYMKKFKEIFGYYPKSIGCWFVDAYTLNYLYKKYGIVASCNCKDQIGTDGYTLWGGYWNQGYYPSLKNAYMPAQDEKHQIPVPVFRMLGSDPISQYDAGIGTNGQGVVTMEPVYKFGGGDSSWVHWYFKQFIEGESLAFAYVQVGQENSFTWPAMAKGFNIQMPLIARLRNEGKIQVETLAETGKWFRNNFKVTPPTSVTVTKGIEESNKKTVWFDSRFYRMNLLWDDSTLRFRDIHLFNEHMTSPYLTKKSTSGRYSFFTLPFVDGNRWSSKTQIAGLQFEALINGRKVLIKGSGNPQIKSIKKEVLHIAWPVEFKDTLVMNMNERQIQIEMLGNHLINWYLDMHTAANASLPFRKIMSHQVECEFEDTKYDIEVNPGIVSKGTEEYVFKIMPEGHQIKLYF